MYTVKQIDDDTWSKFIRLSQQGSIFCMPEWCQLFDDTYRILGVFKGDDLQGGIVGFQRGADFISGGYPVTQFQGICVKPHFEDKYSLVEALLEQLSQDYYGVQVINHYSFHDVRPFLWAGYQPLIKYTYLISDPSLEKMEKDTRYEILHNESKLIQCDLRSFYDMYVRTFERKSLPVPVTYDWMQKFFNNFKPVITATKDSAAMVMFDWRRAYYIFGASTGESNSLKVVWEAIKGLKEIDSAGANDRQIALYKRGLGGKLTPYLGAKNV